MAETPPGRRSVLRTLILSAVGLAGLRRFLTPRRPARAGSVVAAVPVADVPADGALVLPDRRCAIVRDGEAIAALDLTCPHLGCRVTGTPEGFACPCHGSRFGPWGERLAGPAPRGLDRLSVERAEGTVTVSRRPS